MTKANQIINEHVPKIGKIDKKRIKSILIEMRSLKTYIL